MTPKESDYDLAERVYDATLAAQSFVSGMATVAVVTVLNGEITTELFDDSPISSANLHTANSYANACERADNARCYVIGADILDGSD